MDRRERVNDQQEMLRMAVQGMMSRVWTQIPGVIQSFDAVKQSCAVQPTINGRKMLPTGYYAPMQLPILIHCPVLWQGGGGVTATFPITVGDECLIFFSARCIDQWWTQGFKAGSVDTPNAHNDPPEYRMHNISDGFVLVGVRSNPRAAAMGSIDTQNACLITDDGQTYFKLNPTTKAINVQAAGGFNVTATGGITLNGVSIDAGANLSTAGNVISKGKVLATHVHADPQGGSTAVPT